jgi:micrococcal nuclease
MQRFITPVMLLIISFGLDTDHWQKTANKRLSAVTTSIQTFLPDDKEAETRIAALPGSVSPVRGSGPSVQVIVHIGKVTGIVDGDTIEFKDAATKKKYRFRLIEIDAPERDQPWGSKARKALSKKILRKNVELHVQGRDRDGNMIGRVYYKKRDISRELIDEGHAWVHRQSTAKSILVKAEESARSKRLGLWRHENPVSPWNWRREAKTGKG